MKYFLNMITRIKSDLDKLEAYLEGKARAANYLDDSKSDAAFNLRFEKNMIVLEDNYDVDRIIDKIEEMGAPKLGESVREEDNDLPKIKEGSISKRNDGRWMGRYYDQGNRKYVYAKTKIEIIEKLNKAINVRNQRSKDEVISKNIKLNKWIIQWLNLKESDVKKSTLQNYKAYLINRVGKHPIGNKPVNKITSFDIKMFLNEIEAPAARARAFRHLKSCFNALKKHKIIRDNVFDIIDNISEPISKKSYSPEKRELNDFFEWLSVIDKDTYIFAKFLSMTGLRKGEALALTWNDFDGASIEINKSFNYVSKKVSSTKTVSGNRIIPLMPGAIKLLNMIQRKDDEIFSMIPKFHITHKFPKYAKEFGLKRVSLHTLRHYFTTQCYEAGIDEKVVTTWLGHSKSRVTKEIYTHINSGFETKQVDKIAKYWESDD